MALRVSVPEPSCLTMPVPEMMSATLIASERLKLNTPLLTMAPVPNAPEVAALPATKVLPVSMLVPPV